MLFVTVSPKEQAHYDYICARLSPMVNRMSAARKKLESLANSSFDKLLAKSVYLLASESLQCENEIRSHIDSLNCSSYEQSADEEEQKSQLFGSSNLDNICNFFEEVYLKSYKKLLKDKKFTDSIKELLENHTRLLHSSLTQLRLFHDVIYVAN